MQFKIGDKVMINKNRKGLHDESDLGRVGVIKEIETSESYWGPYAVYTPDAIYFCMEREIDLTDAPRLPWDNEQDFREWSREVRSS